MRRVSVIVAVVVLAGTLVVAGCGASSTGSSSSTPTGGGTPSMSASDILSKAQTSMDGVQSVALTGDVTLSVKADAAKMTDPQAKALAQSPISVHFEGKVANKTAGNKADLSMSLQAGGQDLTFGVKSSGKKTWLQFMDKWYVLPPGKSKTIVSAAGGDSSRQLSRLGIDPATWGSSTVTGTEQLAGAAVYHIVAKADPRKIVADMMKVMNDPSLLKAAGSNAATLEQLKSQNAKQLKQLQDSLTSATAELWVDTSSLYVRKAKADATLTFTGDIANQGLMGATIDMTCALSEFNEPVTVTPPPHALPFKQLMSGMFNMAPGGLSTGVTGF